MQLKSLSIKYYKYLISLLLISGYLYLMGINEPVSYTLDGYPYGKYENYLFILYFVLFWIILPPYLFIKISKYFITKKIIFFIVAIIVNFFVSLFLFVLFSSIYPFREEEQGIGVALELGILQIANLFVVLVFLFLRSYQICRQKVLK